MSEPRILFLTRKFPPSRGGMETFSYELTQRYAGPSTFIHYGHRQRDILWAAPLLLLAALRKRKSYDVIHLGDLVLAPLAPWLARFTSAKIVATAHALELTHQNILLQWLVNRGLPAIDHIVAVSEYTADLVRKRGVANARISVITHGAHVPRTIEKTTARKALCDELGLTPEDCTRPILLTVGRLVKRKGVAWFIEHILDNLSQYNPLYLVTSDGPHRDRIEAVADGRDNVRLLGKVSEEQLEQLYAAADIFVMPNIDESGDAEGFGFVAIEAAVRGLPVLSSNIEGIPSAIHDGKNGRLVDPGDITAYTNVLTSWLADPLTRQAFAENAKTYTEEHFHWDDRVRQYQRLFETLV